MPHMVAYIPYRVTLEDIADQIIAFAPNSSGFETDEILLICDGVRSAATVASQLRLEVIHSADETEFLSTRLWVREQPGIQAEVAALSEQFNADFAAYRIVHIDAADRHVAAVVAVLAAVGD